MKIKSYFSETVEDAMAKASQELGADAMLLNSRRAPPEARHLGEYEVVFAANAAPADFTEKLIEAPDPSRSLPPGLSDGISKEVAEMKREIESMRAAITRSIYASPPWLGAAPHLADACAALAANEVPPDLAREIVEAAEERITGSRPALKAGPRRVERSAFQRALAEEIESRFTVQPTLGKSESQTRITALIGPPGAGKTTTLVKVAVHYGLASRRPVLLLSVDTYRVAAAEQLRSYAAILGVGFQFLETVTGLAQTIEENRQKDLILIDTPGLGAGDMDTAAALAQFLSSRGDIDTQLVVSSSMKSADLSHVMSRFEVFRPDKLLFTRLDETSSFGPIFSEAARTGKPLSFFGTGQRIPEDLEAATRAGLVDRVLRFPGGQARSAA